MAFAPPPSRYVVMSRDTLQWDSDKRLNGAAAAVKTSQSRSPDTPDVNAGNPPRKFCACGAAVVSSQLGHRAGCRCRRNKPVMMISES